MPGLLSKPSLWHFEHSIFFISTCTSCIGDFRAELQSAGTNVVGAFGVVRGYPQKSIPLTMATIARMIKNATRFDFIASGTSGKVDLEADRECSCIRARAGFRRVRRRDGTPRKALRPVRRGSSRTSWDPFVRLGRAHHRAIAPNRQDAGY